MLLDGVHVPLTTPFYPDGRLYLRKLEHNVRRYSLVPVQGLIALGAASEHAALTDAEQRDVLQTVAETALPDKVLTATLHHAGCGPALELAQTAAALHYDVLLLAPPAQYRDSHDTVGMWFRVIADSAPLPCLLGTVCGGKALDLALLAEVATHPNVLGALEETLHVSRVATLKALTAANQRSVVTTTTFTAATRRMLAPVPSERMEAGAATFVSVAALAGGTAVAEALPAAAMKTRSKEVSTQILWSHAADATEALRAGATGLAPAIAASVPQAVFEIWAGWKDGDSALMQEKQARVAAAEPLLLGAGAPLMKAAAELSGYFGGRPRLPLVAPSASEQSAVAKAVQGMRS